MSDPFRVDINSSFNVRQIRKLATKKDYRKELTRAGVIILNRIDTKFDQQESFGKRWRQSKAAKDRNGKTLIDTRDLQKSITIQGSAEKPASAESRYQLNDFSLKIGTRLPYYRFYHEEYKVLDLEPETIELLVRDMEASLLDDI